MIELAAVLIALGLLMYLAYRGVTLILLAPAAALVAVALSDGGGISPRKGIPFGTWQVRLLEWARDRGLMDAQQAPPPKPRAALPDRNSSVPGSASWGAIA